MDTRGYAAVVLAGGSGRRLGGAGKPTLPVAGEPMLVRVLRAVGSARARVVVGPPALGGLLPAGTILTREQPPGGGPVAALAAGLAALTDPAQVVVVLAADLPLLSPGAVAYLLARLPQGAAGTPPADGADLDGADLDGAVYVDGSGRRQWLCGAWRFAALRDRVRSVSGGDPGVLAGRSLRSLFDPLRLVEVTAPNGVPPPWYDCDTDDELAAAERLWRAAEPEDD